MVKPSEALRFLGGLIVIALVLGLLVLRVTSCAPLPKPGESHLKPAKPAPPPAQASLDCRAPGWEQKASINASSLNALPWSPFGRLETGWATYAPIIEREIGVGCGPTTPRFAQAFAAWQKRAGLTPDGLVSEAAFVRLKGVVQSRRPFVLISAEGVCPPPPSAAQLANATVDEGYGGKAIQLRPGALAAYRRMVAAARNDDPAIAADPRNLQIFSGYRDPVADAQRCQAEGNCNGIVRATCSAHRTGLAMDLYVGQAPGYPPDSSADPNRLAMTQGPVYQWLVKNADRFGFVNYPFEPWHWEWTGEHP